MEPERGNGNSLLPGREEVLVVCMRETARDRERGRERERERERERKRERERERERERGRKKERGARERENSLVCCLWSDKERGGGSSRPREQSAPKVLIVRVLA